MEKMILLRQRCHIYMAWLVVKSAFQKEIGEKAASALVFIGNSAYFKVFSILAY